jgi:hypothetical protein
MIQKCVTLPGKTDESTHAVEEYCCWFGDALTGHDFDSQCTRVVWAEQGCGLPIIAFARSESVPPITGGGVVHCSPEECADLKTALHRALQGDP